MLHGSTFFCMAISLFGYEAGIFLRKKLKIGIFNPLLVSIIFVIIVLKVTGIDYDTYDKGANVLSYLLTPSTVCLAIPLYQQMNLLKKNLKAIRKSNWLIFYCPNFNLMFFFPKIWFSLIIFRQITISHVRMCPIYILYWHIYAF